VSDRTPGWPEGASESCLNYTAEQHAEVAAALLDGQCIANLSEDAWDGKPPWRHYTAVDEDDDEPRPDYGPFLAAITHALLAQVKGTHNG
jgi:hypothetical protein